MKNTEKTCVAIAILMLAPALAAGAAIEPSTAAGWQLADLRSFLHGEATPPPKAPPPKQLANVTAAASVAVDTQIERFLRALAEGIKARDAKALLPQLSDKYAIDDLPAEQKATTFFAQAIEQIAGPSEIVIMAIENQGGIRTAKIELRYADAKTRLKTFQFDAAGKLLRSDLFKLQSRQAGI